MPNHLQNETSPYLLQHAENPVDWYPWGEEAFRRARKEDKPVFLSIGYSACHWCHVMAHESFEDPETAALLSRASTADGRAEPELLEGAIRLYKRLFDRENGGFGGAPKFPSPHNLLFLLAYHRRRGDRDCLEMAERTLAQMFRGGLFDHIGGGFCRYSTDARFLVPHFEKMLYDNALLILAYCEAYSDTKKELYLLAAERQLDFLAADARRYPAGYAVFLLALLDYRDPPPKVTAGKPSGYPRNEPGGQVRCGSPVLELYSSDLAGYAALPGLF